MATRLLKQVPEKLDSVMALQKTFTAQNKSGALMNLIIGAYRDRSGKPYVFESVKEAKRILQSTVQTHEYEQITGNLKFLEKSRILYGLNTQDGFDNVQSLSGTGALKLAADFLKQTFVGHNIGTKPVIYVPNPTWDNHHNIFETSGLHVDTYNYLTNDRFDADTIIENINRIPDDSIIVLHACAHNPTGYDLDEYQYAKIVKICQSKNLFPLVDMAYLGFASGTFYKDLALVRKLNDSKLPCLIATSYAKNFGLYSARCGNLFFRGYSPEENENMKSILRYIIRTSYSSPPAEGSNIITTILSDPKLNKMWEHELTSIVDHYKYIRRNLRDKLENEINKDFSSITEQVGMFWYSGGKITLKENMLMRSKGIYFLDNGRISLAGLNDINIDQFTKVLADAKQSVQ